MKELVEEGGKEVGLVGVECGRGRGVQEALCLRKMSTRGGRCLKHRRKERQARRGSNSLVSGQRSNSG